MAGTRFTRAQLDACRGATVPDLLGGPADPPTKLLFVGINPGLWTAAAGAHFARPGNRFWPALHLAGITPRPVDASAGMSADDVRMVLDAGIGITNLVPVATARADELTHDELRHGGQRAGRAGRSGVARTWSLSWASPRTGRPSAHATPSVGRQPERSGDAACGCCRTRAA